jgi:glycerol kinase
MSRDYLLAIDQSTSGTKALVIDRSGAVVARSEAGHRQFYPAPGWVEHDPVEIYRNVVRLAREALREAGIGARQLAALTITNQRETAVLWDRTTGLPVHNAIVWQCRRTSGHCAKLRADGHEPAVLAATGLMLDPYFSATKWRWMLDHADGAREKLREGKLLAGTIDSWLIWKLTGGRVHATDYTNASRTSLYNIHALDWDDDMCALFGVPRELLPEVKPSDDIYGYTAEPELWDEPVPITGVIGDSQAALFGQMCHEPGMAKATYGTGTSVLMNIGPAPVSPGNGLVTAIAWGRGGAVTYALEGIIRTSGDTIKWVRDNLGLFNTFEEMDDLLKQAPDNEGVYLVPAFVGLGAPWWAPDARAAITGMSRSTGRAHIVRAALESIAYQVCDAIELMQRESGVTLAELRADGGASRNAELMRFQADLLDKAVAVSEVAELSAMGSAFLGGLGTGFWPSPAHLPAGGGRRFEPKMGAAERQRLLEGWRKAVRSVLEDR